MKVENKRIFISDLPETVTQDELENAFKHYGNVASVEIKERKELGPKNNSLFFAYINVEIDDRNLQQCFKDFGKRKWMGHQISLQIARESFLDRLKREREETGAEKTSSSSVKQLPVNCNITPKLKVERQKFKIETDSSSSETENKAAVKIEKESLKSNSNNISIQNGKEKDSNDRAEVIDLVIKSNKGKIVDKNGLKIESVGKSPILTIDKSKKKASVNTSEANLRRLQSLNNLKKNHQTQKSLIQQALSKIDNRSNKKMIIDETEESVGNKSYSANIQPRMSLFDEELEEDDLEPNFKIKEQFEGEKGKKLLELQTKYKSDRRFVLDERFLDDNEEEGPTENQLENNEEISLEEEKKKEYEILEQVLGKKVVPKQSKTESTSQKKVMLRFDPTQPEHSKFELKNEAKKEKKKRKRDNSESDLFSEKKREETEAPEVSKEVFYKVTEDLKDSLKEKREFSLLSMFGRAEEKEQDEEQKTTINKIRNASNNFIKEKNPFRYDSSDDEDETEGIPSLDTVQQMEKPSEVKEPKTTTRNIFWSEPFFFADDDYRLQEGVDFVEKMSTKEDNDFRKLRRDLKEIVKAKVRNNQRKNRPFKKKLGGSKKKKMLRIKKALKR